jgi:hypothetical protein
MLDSALKDRSGSGSRNYGLDLMGAGTARQVIRLVAPRKSYLRKILEAFWDLEWHDSL